MSHQGGSTGWAQNSSFRGRVATGTKQTKQMVKNFNQWKNIPFCNCLYDMYTSYKVYTSVYSYAFLNVFSFFFLQKLTRHQTVTEEAYFPWRQLYKTQAFPEKVSDSQTNIKQCINDTVSNKNFVISTH